MPSLRLLRIEARHTGGDAAALARAISAAAPDLVCVHGAPSLLRWRSKCAALARMSGLVVVGGGRTGGGNLVLSSMALDVETTRDVAFGTGRGPRPAGATLAVLARGSARLAVAAVRLDGDARQQSAQLAELDRAVARLVPDVPPLVLAVDGAGSGAAVTLQAGRSAPAAGVFVDAAITAVAGDDGTLELTATP